MDNISMRRVHFLQVLVSPFTSPGLDGLASDDNQNMHVWEQAPKCVKDNNVLSYNTQYIVTLFY